MDASFKSLAEAIGLAVEAVGIAVIVFGLLFASLHYLDPRHRRAAEDAWRSYRQEIGRSILLGLEFLVAGDIIRSVTVEPELANVLVLGLIVLIRTFLSIALEVELQGRWPWQQEETPRRKPSE